MYVKPTCPTPLKLLLVLVIVAEVVAIGFLAADRAGALDTLGASVPEAPASNEVASAGSQGGSIGGGGSAGENAASVSQPQSPQTPSDAGSAAEPISITVTFAGDCVLGTDANRENSRSFNSRWEDEGADASYFLRNVADLFGADDLTIVNLEGALTDRGKRVDKSFAFRGKPDYAEILSSGSVEAASLANNHSRDYGQEGYDDTIEALGADGVKAFDINRIAYFDVKGAKVAVVGAYAPEDGEGNDQAVADDIAAARAEGAQLVIVYAYWGGEYESNPSEEQVALGHAAIDAGADVVVGTHPHIIQGWERYKGRYIVYSLGNFCFGGNTNPDDKDCLIFQQTFTVTGDEVAKNDDVDFIAASVSTETDRNTYQPVLAEGDEKARIDAKVQEAADRIAAAS